MSQQPDLLDLSDQVAIVTGASRGIGKVIAEVLAGVGARVALLARRADLLETAAADLCGDRLTSGETVMALPTDVAVPGEVDEAVSQVVKRWGRIDILVNNAGLISFGPVWDVEPAEWERVVGANLSGAYLCSRAVALHMCERQYGRIVNISSVSAQTGGVSGGVHYSASKAGMLGLTRTLARDLAPHVTVNAITPGQIDADPDLITAEQREKVTAMIPLGRLGEPKEIAYAVLFLVSPMASYVTGATLDVNGGILKR